MPHFWSPIAPPCLKIRMYQYNIVHQSLKVQSAYLNKIKYPQNAYAVTEKHENMPYS